MVNSSQTNCNIKWDLT